MNDITELNKLTPFLLKQLRNKSIDVGVKYKYYNAENTYKDFGIAVPIKMMNTKPGVGWASRAVNTLSDRVVFDGFADDSFGINELFDRIGARTVINGAKKDAHIAGVSFIAISDGRLIPFTAKEATGVYDDNTGRLKYGLAVLEWQADNELNPQSLTNIPKRYAVFTPSYTAVFNNEWTIYPNPTGRTLLHHISHGSTASQRLGRSRITKTVRRIIQEVARVKRRYEIAGEFYSTPQRFLLGTEQEMTLEDKAKLDSTVGKVWAFSKDDDGDRPEVGQLPQMSINQFEENKKGLARDFCAETGLTLRNLGYETANPTSADSLIAMSDDLLLEAKSSQDEMGEQIRQLAISLRMAIDGTGEVPERLLEIKTAWQPIFQVDLGATGDAIYKLSQVMPELIGTVEGYRMLGVGIRQAEELARRRLEASTNDFMRGDEL